MTERTDKQKTYTKYYHDTSLPTIVMIHGFRGTHHGLDLIAKDLKEFHVIIPDLPGFGETKPLNERHTVKAYSDWLESFIDEFDFKKPPILLGHSFGSIVTSYFASRHPEKISKLILVNPIGAPALEGPKAIMTQLARLYYWLGEKLPESAGTKLLKARPIVMIMSISMAKTKDKNTRKFIHDQHLSHFSSFANRKVLSEAFDTSITNDVRQVAKKISVPTLLIAGKKDDITPILKQRSLQKLFSDAKLKEIDNVGHLTHYETPDLVAQAIKDFASLL